MKLLAKLQSLWNGLIVSGDDVALDFMSDEEVAEILATEDLFDVNMENLDFLDEDVATDSDYE